MHQNVQRIFIIISRMKKVIVNNVTLRYRLVKNSKCIKIVQ